MTFDNRPFFEDQRIEHKGKCLAEISKLLKNFSPIELCTSNIRLGSFLVSMLPLEIMPASTVYSTVSTIR